MSLPEDYEDYDNEPYFCHIDYGLGMCGECGSFLENWGAVSQGDGDLYDELGCPNCQVAETEMSLWLSENTDDESYTPASIYDVLEFGKEDFSE